MDQTERSMSISLTFISIRMGLPSLAMGCFNYFASFLHVHDLLVDKSYESLCVFCVDPQMTTSAHTVYVLFSLLFAKVSILNALLFLVSCCCNR